MFQGDKLIPEENKETKTTTTFWRIIKLTVLQIIGIFVVMPITLFRAQ